MHEGAGCPSERDLQAFARDELDTQAATAVRAHLDDCVGCQETLTEIRRCLGLEEPITRDIEPIAQTWDLPTQTEGRRPGLEEALELRLLLRSTDPKAIGRIASYEIYDVLGRGGMGIVLDAFDTVLHRRVAIKVLSPQLATSQTAHRRFIREARAAAGINHANVVTVHAVAEQAGMPYLVMEYVAGKTLRERIRDGPLDLATMLRIGAQIAAGLAAAHQHGVIHRDIKPGNVLLEDGVERVKISDFGLALVLDNTNASSADRPVGTPAYMSPEQVGGQRVDARSDLFSLGCVLYAMSTGKSPFQGSSSVFIARMIAEFDPPALHEVNRDTPRFLSDIVARLLHKDPNKRFQSAAEVRDLLLAHLAEVNQAPSDSLNRAVRAPQPRPNRRRWWLAGGVSLMLLVALVAAGVYFWPASGSPLLPPQTPGTVVKPLLTVAQSGDADHESIAAALRAAGPGTTIRILDAAVYKESLHIDEPTRLHDLTIEANQGASLESSTAEAVVTIRNTSGVVLRGLHIRTHEGQFATSVHGACPGLTLEKLSLVQPPAATHAALALWPGTHGTAEQPVLLRGLNVNGGTIGIALVGVADQPVSWVRIEDCRIASTGVHIVMESRFADVAVVGNLFIQGRKGVSLGSVEAGRAKGLHVVHNTFFGTHAWLALSNCSLDQSELRIACNLILESQEILTGQDLTPVARRWFHNNWWERSEGFNQDQAKQVAMVKDEVKLISRDSASDDFLRPAPGQFPTPEAGADAERPYIGARSPAATRPPPASTSP